MVNPEDALFLNCGGQTEVGDGTGRVWIPDDPFLAPDHALTHTYTSQDSIDPSLLSDQDVPEEILRSERWRDGDIQYQIPVPNLDYRVVLYFSENWLPGASRSLGGTGCEECERVFDVEVEGLRVEDYSPADAAILPSDDGVGATLKATELFFDVSVTDGILDIRVLDLGPGNPPENASIKALAVHALETTSVVSGVETCFRRGDVNGNGQLDIADGLLSLAFLLGDYDGPPVWEVMDVNDDGVIDFHDPIASLTGQLVSGEELAGANEEICVPGLDPETIQTNPLPEYLDIGGLATLPQLRSQVPPETLADLYEQVPFVHNGEFEIYPDLGSLTPIAATPEPDLTVRFFDSPYTTFFDGVTPLPLLTDRKTVITVSVRNVGLASVNGRFATRLYVDGGMIHTWPFPSAAEGEDTPGAPEMKPGETRLYSHEVLMGGGSHVIKVVVDADSQIRESDESTASNTASLKVDAQAAPDLVVVDIAPTTPPVPGVSSAWSISVRNVGSGPAGPFMTSFMPRVVGGSHENFAATGLAAGATITFETQQKLRSTGTKSFIAIVDSAFQVTESNENNNTKEKAFTIDSVDLWASVGAVVDEKTFQNGRVPVTVEGTASNYGQVNAKEPFKVRFMPGAVSTTGLLVPSLEEVPGLDVNQSRTIEREIWVKPGRYRFFFDVDYPAPERTYTEPPHLLENNTDSAGYYDVCPIPEIHSISMSVISTSNISPQYRFVLKGARFYNPTAAGFQGNVAIESWTVDRIVGTVFAGPGPSSALVTNRIYEGGSLIGERDSAWFSFNIPAAGTGSGSGDPASSDPVEETVHLRLRAGPVDEPRFVAAVGKCDPLHIVWTLEPIKLTGSSGKDHKVTAQYDYPATKQPGPEAAQYYCVYEKTFYNLKSGRWRVTFKTATATTSCEVDLDAGARVGGQNHIHFSLGKAGCTSDAFSFP